MLLTNCFVKIIIYVMEAGAQVVESLDAAAVLLEPGRIRLLRVLAEPDSAAGLARRLGLPRQRVNYHLRELERAGFVRLVEERRKRNCVERIVQATARSYVISPAALAELGPEPADVRDRFSWAQLVALAAGVLRDLGILRRRADQAGQKLLTLSLAAPVRLASPAAFQRFADDLCDAVAGIIARHHDEHVPEGRLFSLVVGVHPTITDKDSKSVQASGSDAGGHQEGGGASGAGEEMNRRANRTRRGV